MLSLEIGELGEAGFDLSLTGFDEFELGELLAERTQGRTDPDDAPEPPAHPVAEPGDLWVLGRHRLLCGDSTVALSTSSAFSSSAVKVTNSPRAYSYPLTTSRLSISSPVAGSCGRSVTRVAVGLWSPSRLASSASRGEIKYLSQGEIEAHNRGYSPHSAATWRAWEYWANRAGCGHLLTLFGPVASLRQLSGADRSAAGSFPGRAPWALRSAADALRIATGPTVSAGDKSQPSTLTTAASICASHRGAAVANAR